MEAKFTRLRLSFIVLIISIAVVCGQKWAQAALQHQFHSLIHFSMFHFLLVLLLLAKKSLETRS